MSPAVATIQKTNGVGWIERLNELATDARPRDRVVVLVREPNQQLLVEWLSPRYEVRTGVEALATEFDLWLADVPSFQAARSLLQARRAESGLLPGVLVVPRDRIAAVSQQVWQEVDETIAIPVEKAELEMRLAVLLRSRRLARELQQANEKLQEMNQLKSRFVSLVSHEFRNPLSAIAGLTQMLERQGDRWAVSKREEVLQRIRASVKHLSDLVDDVLVIGRVGVGKLHCQPERVDVSQVCRDIVQTAQLGGDREILFVDRADHWQADLDPTLLRHVLDNLLGNAVKYSAPNTHVELLVKREGNLLRLQVSDRGIGIPESDRDRLGEPFFRAGNVAQIEGTGLGLAIVKECVELQGGAIAWESEVKVGTTVTVTLPLTSSPA